MKKADRELIKSKFGGRCAYCGCELGIKWHCDHKEPVNRIQKRVDGYYRHKVTKERIEREGMPSDWFTEHEYVTPKLVFDRMQFPERDTVENSLPSCSSCNLYKSTMPIELFREQIGKLVSRLNQSYTQYKIAKRFGLVMETDKEVKFYFELETKK